MKKLLLLFATLFVVSAGMAQTITTEGTRFWVSFAYHPQGTTTDSNGNQRPIPESRKYSLIISAQQACTGLIENPRTGWSVPFAVGDNGITEIEIPTAQGQVGNTFNNVVDKGLLVTSTEKVSLYASSFQNYSFDVSYVLPEAALSDEYLLQMYPADPGGEAIVVATEDNTIVDITPSAETLGGRPAGVPYTVTLNAGQVHQFLAYYSSTNPLITDKYDLSGTIVKARNCKKIAVFNGNPVSYVPEGFCCGDIIFEQALPLNRLGKHFAITEMQGQTANRVRITATADGTEVRRNGALVATLAARQTYEMEITATERSCFVETTKPCAVFQYMTGLEYSGAGDPSMVLVPPVEQQIKEVTFAAFDTQVTKSHQINIVTNTSDVPTITLDGTLIASAFEPLAGNADLSFARLNIAAGAHTLKSEKGFTAFAYGYGAYETYAYSVGSSAIDLTQQLIVNEIAAQSHTLCLNELSEFRAVLNYEPTLLEWTIDGNKYQGKQILHSFYTYGDHEVSLRIGRQESNCSGEMFETLTATIHVPDTRRTMSRTICAGQSVELNGKTFDRTGTYTETVSGNWACDSLITLNLRVYDPRFDVRDARLCKGASQDLRELVTNVQDTNLKYSAAPDGAADLPPVVSPQATTTYYAVAVNEANCPLVKPITLTVTDKPTVGVLAPLAPVCEGGKLNLSPPEVTNGGEPLTWQSWELNGAAFNSGETVAYALNGARLAYAVQNVCGVVRTNEVLLTVDRKPEHEFPTYRICAGESVQLEAPEADSYLWTPGGSTMPAPVVSPKETTVYTLTATRGSCSPQYEVPVAVVPLPVIEAVRRTAPGEVLVVTRHADNYLYWLDSFPPQNSPRFAGITDGRHTATVATSEGCADSREFRLGDIVLPPYFSPNGDGKADLWEVEGLDTFREAKLYIYNRYGQMLVTLDAERPSWDGTYMGNAMPSTDYWYLLEIPEFGERRVGHFTLKR